MNFAAEHGEFCDQKIPPAAHQAGFNKRGRLFTLMHFGHGTKDVAAAQAAGAYIHPLGGTIHRNTDALHVGCPYTMGLAVGVAHAVAVEHALSANVTQLSHGLHLIAGAYTLQSPVSLSQAL